MLFFFFFNDTATTEIYTLSLHDALPISTIVIHRITLLKVGNGIGMEARTGQPGDRRIDVGNLVCQGSQVGLHAVVEVLDRKSTRLNSSHANISYAVFCLKKKKKLLSLDS